MKKKAMIDLFEKIIDIIYNDFISLPNYSHFQIVINIYKFLIDIISDK